MFRLKDAFKVFRYLKFQIAAYYFLTSLIAVILLGTVLHASISSMFLDEALSSTTTSVEENGRLIDEYLSSLKSLAKVVSNDPDTISYLSTGDVSAKEKTRIRIQQILDADSSLYSAALVSKKGDIISNKDNLMTVISNDMMDEPWYADVMKSKGMPVLTSIRRQTLTMDKSTWVISVGQEIVDQKGEHLGVFLLDFSYQVIENQLDRLDLGKEGDVFILTDTNALVYHKDPSYFDSSEKLDKLVSISKMGTGYDIGMNKLTHHYRLNNANWILVGLSSLDRLTIARQRILESMVSIGIVLLFIVLGSGVVIAASITRPIIRLQQAMQDFSKDLTTLSISTSGCYEVDNLRNHFNDMAEKIRGLMEDVKEQERYLSESELKILYSQINPHFLYNTLDTIVWMAEFDDSENVISITKALSRFFRLSLSKGSDFIPLSQELDHVRQYLIIQEKRYADKLNYTFISDIDEVNSTYDPILVPKIILQPLVENAIYHGIKPLKAPGQIIVKSSFDNEAGILTLEVTDNGVGFDPSKVESETLERAENETKLGGVGIDNVIRRLDLIYKNQATFKIFSEVGVGTTVLIRIPTGKA